jgi:predicted MPP superfamily phosphohydrolase
MFGLRLFMYLFVVLDLSWWLWADLRLRRLPRARFWRLLLAPFILVQIGGVILRLSFTTAVRGSAGFLPPWLLAAQYLWHLLVLPAAFLWILLFRIVRLGGIGIWGIATGKPLAVWRKTPTAGPAPVPAPGLTRRELLGAAAVAAPPLMIGAITPVALRQFGHFRIRRVRLPVAGLPANLDGIRIAHVSDIHVGRFLPPSMLPKIVEATNQLHADLILLTGDLIDFSQDDLPPAIEAVKRMDPHNALAMCIGNHDLIEDGRAFSRRVTASGIPLLADSAMTVRVRNEEVQLLGLPWMGGDMAAMQSSVSRLTRMRRPGAFPIVMSHHPHAFDPAVDANFPLMLSGHTHGGQLMLTDQIGAGPAFFRYWSGLYRKRSSALFVSNGVGNWFPLRINAPAEIVEITLVRMTTG